ncbi:hypothetical protein MKW94_023454 [Papaver nudicaule]|uniref:Uncharacterized protein n=1 Tax=Papaver nudicaule TaxID=74823 RepID=A0AA41VSJ3_PAPNU|nr:hypothetical protein [Papaver nudicaule]
MEITCSSANSGKSQPSPLPENSQRHVLTLRCCSTAIPSPLDDNKAPIVHPDWRSYRAKLVTNEQLSRPQGSSNLPIDPPIENRHHSSVTSENTWAHILEAPEKGCLLIATEKLDGVNIFKQTVILILSVDSKCSTGVILNKPSSMTRSAVTDGQLYFGGPLDDDLVLVSLKKNGDEEVMIKRSGIFEEVIEGLYYGTKQNSLCCVDEMVKRDELRVEDFRVFEGYCWWDNKKLRDEIKSGSWKVIACSPNIFSSLN